MEYHTKEKYIQKYLHILESYMDVIVKNIGNIKFN